MSFGVALFLVCLEYPNISRKPTEAGNGRGLNVLEEVPKLKLLASPPLTSYIIYNCDSHAVSCLP